MGAILAERLGARFIHNHLLHDVAIAVTAFDAAERWPLYETIRAAYGEPATERHLRLR